MRFSLLPFTCHESLFFFFFFFFFFCFFFFFFFFLLSACWICCLLHDSGFQKVHSLSLKQPSHQMVTLCIPFWLMGQSQYLMQQILKFIVGFVPLLIFLQFQGIKLYSLNFLNFHSKINYLNSLPFIIIIIIIIIIIGEVVFTKF